MCDYNSWDNRRKKDNFKSLKSRFETLFPEIIEHPHADLLIKYAQALKSTDKLENLGLLNRIGEARKLRDEKYAPFLQQLAEHPISGLENALTEFEMRLKLGKQGSENCDPWEESAFRYLVELKKQLDSKEVIVEGERYYLVTADEKAVLDKLKAGDSVELETRAGFKAYTPMATKKAPAPKKKKILEFE